jgi:hypothetical protein
LFIIEYFFSIFGDIMGPTPPTNYRVIVENGIKTLFFDNSSNDVNETEIKVELEGQFVSIGKTTTNSIAVPPHVEGKRATKGNAEGLSGWGLYNNPPVIVDYLA